MDHGTDTWPAVIIGTGCAGLSAAAVLAEAGVDVLIIDEAAQPGGQLLRGKWPARDLAARLDRSKAAGFSLIGRLNRSRVTLMSGARVYGIFPGHTLLVIQKTSQGKETVREINSPAVILATGARERFLPFKGWNLPGVMASGAAQLLIKTHGVLPARTTLVAGTSPLNMVLASQILTNGGRVNGILNPVSPARGMDLLRRLPDALPKLLEGAIHQARIFSHRVPVKYRTGIVEARGKNGLEAVVTQRLDHEGRPVPGTQRIYRTRALALSHGFVPNVELAIQAGCDVTHEADKGGWVVKTGNGLRTSVPGILAAGEVTGIGGGAKSLLEGRMAALTLLDRPIDHLIPAREKALDFGTFLNGFCRIPKSFWHHLPDETIICRCENVTMGDIRRAAANGFETPAILKRATRAGMGHCQGRTCGPMIQDILAALIPETAQTPYPSVSRMPVKTMPIGPLIQEDVR